MNKSTQKIIFVDFYGILSSTRYWFSLENPKHKWHSYFAGIQDFLLVKNRELLDDWMKGKYTSEDIHHILAEKLDLNFDELFQVFVEDCKKIEFSKKILKKLQTLSEQYLCIMVTDNMDSFNRFFLSENKIIQNSFHEICNSFYFQKLKDDRGGEIFLDILQKYNADIVV
ncbi:MAG: hypothetical protein COY69_00100 [Candidatus Magasanikbacteria bacterium CG_4_10_14_0_8_um_filter_32_14]|uniref:Haloacid dehalogenase n=1 Tax=Candidatus Magasanikbacteria bacterium CG_4_10_14_0_8_um_filter_32_14 TaxID=1974640 RepID=A0A2M7RBL7_9BACT|nr:MAG: hypothetical protein COY69_00100 [Candidatus Magasanikbacteria bacterium CG_4_10_14_0_8_um_filter_32_14]